MSIRAGGEYLSAWSAGRYLGLQIDDVRDVRKGMALTAAPYAPPAVAGLMNLRGRALVAVDVRAALDLPPLDDARAAVAVFVDVEGEQYSLLLDSVGEVIRPRASDFAPTPANLDATWRDVCQGFFWQEQGLLHVICLPALLGQVVREAA